MLARQKFNVGSPILRRRRVNNHNVATATRTVPIANAAPVQPAATRQPIKTNVDHAASSTASSGANPDSAKWGRAG